MKTWAKEPKPKRSGMFYPPDLDHDNISNTGGNNQLLWANYHGLVAGPNRLGIGSQVDWERSLKKTPRFPRAVHLGVSLGLAESLDSKECR